MPAATSLCEDGRAQFARARWQEGGQLRTGQLLLGFAAAAFCLAAFIFMEAADGWLGSPGAASLR